MQLQNAPYFSVGLTGGIGCGKSTVADLFAAHGATIVDTDQIAHSLTAPNGAAMPALVAEFGPDYADARGALDRTKMRNLVFADAAARGQMFPYSPHSPDYVVDLAAIPLGARIAGRAMLELLAAR